MLVTDNFSPKWPTSQPNYCKIKHLFVVVFVWWLEPMGCEVSSDNRDCLELHYSFSSPFMQCIYLKKVSLSPILILNTECMSVWFSWHFRLFSCMLPDANAENSHQKMQKNSRYQVSTQAPHNKNLSSCRTLLHS